MRPWRGARGAAAAVAIAAFGACGERTLPPTGQVLLYVDTDAILPPPPGAAPSPDDPTPLFDRLRVDVFEPGAQTPCDGCTREFALDRDLVKQGRASFGIPAAPSASGYRARLRMYLAKFARADGPPASGAVDVIVALPTVGAEGVVERSVVLSTESVGAPMGTLDAPIETAAGRPATSLVGTWPRAARVPCNGDPKAGEACIPGGAYWMGSPLAGLGSTLDEDIPRLVVLAPYFMDTTEVTVAAFRDYSNREGGAAHWSGMMTGQRRSDYCTLTDAPGPFESDPINCVVWTAAHAYCVERGGDIPTEAQYEYVASAFAGHAFVWGDDPPSCDDAVWGRGGWGIYALYTSPCSPAKPPGGVLPVGSGARDRITVGQGPPIVDLVGSLSEWGLDFWNQQTEPCWTTPGVFVDPLCKSLSPGDGRYFPLRGGSWLSTANVSIAAIRQADGIEVFDTIAGFRCARPASGAACASPVTGKFTGSIAGGENEPILSFAVGCSGIVSAEGARDNMDFYLVAGAVDPAGHVTFGGRDFLDTEGIEFEGMFQGTRATGTWSTSGGKKGTWTVSR